MGRRGPLPKPRLAVTGGRKAICKPQPTQSEPNADLLKLPSGLTSGAKRRWLTLAPMLLEDGRLKADTREALINYVRLADEADVLGEQLTAEGVVLTTPHGAIANPKSKILAGIRSTLLRYSAACGLDPASKARLGAAGVLDLRTPAERQADADFQELIGGM